jgi:myosin heavy subunit
LIEKNKQIQDSFTITHFAGEVSYNAKGFLEKTKDTLSLDLIKALKTSKNKLIIESWNREGEPIKSQFEGLNSTPSRASLTRAKTVTDLSKV